MGRTAEIAPPVGSFLGRDEELVELSGLLEDARLVTLVGPPGIGKSRLATELAGRLGESYGGATALVELASVGDGAHVPAAVASALSVKETPGEDLAETLVRGLAGQRVLLVVDNCEHVLVDCAGLLSPLLAGCPELSVIATSREPLAIAGETAWQVPPLPFPDRSEGDTGGELIDHAAVRLFVERAAAVEPGFSLNDYIAPSVVEVCRRLDGIPLAIELAAGRVELLTPQEIAERLDDRFDLLTDAGAGGPSRHQTLEAALDWSYQLLSEPERALLRRLSVFNAGFDLETAASVCVDEEVVASSVHPVAEQLIAKSLISTTANEGRYCLLETIRAYAEERLEEAGEASSRREAHAGFYLALAEAAEPELTGPAQERWFQRLERENADLRSALKWSIGHGRSEWALRMAGALVLFWRVRSHFSEGRAMLEAALSAGEEEASSLRAKALWGAGFMAHWAGDDEGAIAPSEQSLTYFRELGDPQGCARALLTLGGCRQWREPQRALSLFEQSAELAREANDRWCLVHALSAAGFEHLSRDALAPARPFFDECVAVARSAQDKQSLVRGLIGLGRAAFREGDYRSAEPLFGEAVAVAEEIGDDHVIGWALEYLARLAVAGGHYDRAGALLDHALSVMREGRPARLLVARGVVASALGQRRQARELHEEALTLARATAKDLIPALMGGARIAVEDGEPRAARRMFEEALDIARAAGARLATAQALHGLAELARAEAQVKRAGQLHGEALQIRYESGDGYEIVSSLEAVGMLAVEVGRHQHGALLFGAVDTLRSANGWVPFPWQADQREGALSLLRQALSDPETKVASREGAELTLEDAVSEALRESLGDWASLTDGERRIATLAAEGLTNPEIAERLFLASATVKYHLSRVFTKLGIAGRSELIRSFASGEQREGAAREP